MCQHGYLDGAFTHRVPISALMHVVELLCHCRQFRMRAYRSVTQRDVQLKHLPFVAHGETDVVGEGCRVFAVAQQRLRECAGGICQHALDPWRGHL